MSKQSRVFQTIFLITALHITVTIPLQLSTGPTILINSSHSQNAFEIMMWAEGNQKQHFQIFS